MADITVTIPISAVSYQAWLRTSYLGVALADKEGNPLIKGNEMGPDQEDAFLNFFNEAALMVENLFVTRQGDVAGLPFEVSATEAVYRFKEGEPVLAQTAAIQSVLSEDVKNALYVYITILWFSLKANVEQVALLQKTYGKLVVQIIGGLHRLHD